MACQRCSNYIFILDLTPGFNGLGKSNFKTRRETFKFGDLVCLILEILWYIFMVTQEKWQILRIYSTGSLHFCYDLVEKTLKGISYHLREVDISLGEPWTNVNQDHRCKCCHVFNVRCTKFRNLNFSRLSRLAIAFAQSFEAENEDVVGAAPVGGAPATSVWSTVLVPSKVAPYIRDLTVTYVTINTDDWSWRDMCHLNLTP